MSRQVVSLTNEKEHAMRAVNNDVYIVSETQTTSVDTAAHTVTVETMTYYSDGTWNRNVETWSYID
jgi:hypothetical protein